MLFKLPVKICNSVPDGTADRFWFIGAIIAYFLLNIQNNFQMSLISDSGSQLGLGPAELPGCPEIPFPELHRQVGFHDHNVLRPTELRSQGQQNRMVFICAAEIPHPA